MNKQQTIIISNYFVIAILALTNILSVPLIYKYLGKDQWSLVAITIFTQGFLGFLDFGMNHLIPRDIASSPNVNQRRNIWHQYVFNYIAFPLISLIFIVPIIFLGKYNLPSSYSSLLYAIFGLALYLFQSLNLAHYAIYNGLRRQLLSNQIQSLFSILRVLAVLFFIIYYKPLATTYVFISVLFYVLEISVNLYITNKAISGRSNFARLEYVQGFKSFISKNWQLMLGASVGVLSSNMDRMILITKINPMDFGIYIMVLNFGLYALNLHYPVYKNLLVDACSLKPDVMISRTRHIIRINFIVCVFPCLLAANFAQEILLMWSHNHEVAEKGWNIFVLILVSVALNSVHQLNYLKQLFRQAQRWIVLTNLISISIMVLYLTMISNPSIVDGAICWLLSNAIQMISGFIWSKKRYGAFISYSW
jgi:O-antigen/teichoic acid export membrane protein